MKKSERIAQLEEQLKNVRSVLDSLNEGREERFRSAVKDVTSGAIITMITPGGQLLDGCIMDIRVTQECSGPPVMSFMIEPMPHR